MRSSARFLIAKYVSDLQRMEPRNIGVVVSRDECASARFIGEKPGSPGNIDGRSIPSFVTSAAAYRQWVDFWQAEIRANSDSLMDTLIGSNCGNFWLDDGGILLDQIAEEELPQVTDYLFSTLVEPSSTDEPRDPALDKVVDEIIKSLQLGRNPNFHSRFGLTCSIAPNVNEHFEFSHAFTNGSLKRLYQRVPLARRRAPLRRMVHDSAWMFEKVVEQGIVSKTEAVALVYATEEQKRDPEVNWSFDVLGSVATIANLADERHAMEVFLVS